MRALLTLLTPRYLSFKNSWFGQTSDPLARGVRIGILVTGILFIPYLIYIGIQQSINELEGGESTLGALLEVINITFLSVLFFSSCVHSLNSLFLAKDNEMLIAAPLSPIRLYTGKLLETVITSSWVLLIFYIPSVWAVGEAFHAELFFYPYALLFIVPLIAIPCSISMIACILFVRAYPAQRVREMLVIISILVVIGLHFGLKGQEVVLKTINRDIASSMTGDEALFKNISSSLAHSTLIYLSKPLELAAKNKISLSLQALSAALLIAIASLFASYRCFLDLYLKVFSLDAVTGKLSKKRIRHFIPQWIYYRIPHTWRAFGSKDYKMFVRDLAQPVQLILFLFMGVFAVMGFHASAEMAADMRAKYEWWDALIMFANLGFHTLLSVLFAGRFIFPSIAAEVDAAWIIKCVPVSPKYFFRAKFLVTALPSIIVLMSFLAAACSISALPPFHFFFAMSVGFLNTICIASISIGLGAYFANMRYEHLGQISTGIGSVLSMFISLLVIPVDCCIPMLAGIVLKQYNDSIPDSIIFALCFMLLALIHAAWMKYFISRGRERWISM